MNREIGLTVNAMRNRVAAAALAAIVLPAVMLCSCVSETRVDADSPRVSDVVVSSSSDMTESSQEVQIRIEFDQPVNVDDSFSDDLVFRLNGAEVDASSIDVQTRASGEAITYGITPAAGATGVGNGAYFAVYQGSYSVGSAREDGAVPSVVGASGSCAVIDEPLTGVIPSGLSIQVTDIQKGSTASQVPARTSFRVTSPATVRAITWFSPDGGDTKLIKHNHLFFRSDAEACAEDLAKVVNAAEGLGLSASNVGDEVTITATSVRDGQIIDPMIVEGPEAIAGAYDPSIDGEGLS